MDKFRIQLVVWEKKAPQFNEERYNFYEAMTKIVDFYKAYIERKRPTKQEIVKEANRLSTLFDVQLYIDTELEELEEADALAKDIKAFFATPMKTYWDVAYKGQELMELKERAELFEYWYC